MLARFTYVARWSQGEAALVKDTAKRVIGCARQILASLEKPPRQSGKGSR